MNKQQLLNYINSLPEDLYVDFIQAQDIDYNQISNWESCREIGDFGGIYERNIENVVQLQLNYKTRQRGEFRRTYENPEGSFKNIRRI